jgi:hypothetical protein
MVVQDVHKLLKRRAADGGRARVVAATGVSVSLYEGFTVASVTAGIANLGNRHIT